MYALELLTRLLQKFGGIIDFPGSDLAWGQLSDRLCKAMYSASLSGVGRSIPLGEAVLRVFRRLGAAGLERSGGSHTALDGKKKLGAAGRSVHHLQCCHLEPKGYGWAASKELEAPGDINTRLRDIN